MPTKKSSSKKTTVIRPLYAVPILDAVKRGDSKEMAALAKDARKQLASVKSALAALEKKRRNILTAPTAAL